MPSTDGIVVSDGGGGRGALGHTVGWVDVGVLSMGRLARNKAPVLLASRSTAAQSKAWMFGEAAQCFAWHCKYKYKMFALD